MHLGSFSSWDVLVGRVTVNQTPSLVPTNLQPRGSPGWCHRDVVTMTQGGSKGAWRGTGWVRGLGGWEMELEPLAGNDPVRWFWVAGAWGHGEQGRRSQNAHRQRAMNGPSEPTPRRFIASLCNCSGLYPLPVSSHPRQRLSPAISRPLLV